MQNGYSRNDELSQRRHGYIAGTVVTILFLALVGRLYFFQVIEGEKYRSESRSNSIRTVTLEAPRGLIFDRHGTPLAENRASYTISAIPIEIDDETIVRLGTLIERDPSDLRKRIRDRSHNRFKPLVLKRDASFEIVSRVEEHLIELPGVTVEIEPTRLYPLAGIASHMLGYVAEVSKEQLDRLKPSGYIAGDLVGKSGVEKVYEPYLRGENGLKYVEVNARGQEIGRLESIAPLKPIPGDNVYLSIDARVQLTAERVIPDSLAGSIIAIDPRNGDVLAFVSKPNFDPNLFPTGISPADWKSINEHPKKPLLNRATRGLYPAASTMKIVTGTAGLEQQLTQGGTRFQTYQACVGGYKIGNRWAKCWHKGHGKLDLNGAILNSCDVYFYQLGLRLGLDTWAGYAKMYGLGEETGIDIGEELPGIIPDMSYFDGSEGRVWTRGKMLNLAIGQGELLVTPIQMATLMGAVANGGTIFVPNVMQSIETPQGRKILTASPSVRDTLNVKPETMAYIKQSLVNVVNVGTGARARIRGFQVAGKTGTAENSHGEDHSWFVGYAPAEAPTIAVIAIIENAPHGIAVPMVRQVIESHLIDNPDNKLASLPPGIGSGY
jgi:penicillin-binding protein 2